jgi:hypothetical protein
VFRRECASQWLGRPHARCRSFTVDCADPYRQALIWSEVSGWRAVPHDPNNPGDPEGRIVSPLGFSLLFIPVPNSTATGLPPT